MKKMLAGLLASALSFFGVSAYAVIDITAVTTGVSDAQTAVLAIVAALMGLSIAIFGVVKVYAFIHRKAGA